MNNMPMNFVIANKGETSQTLVLLVVVIAMNTDIDDVVWNMMMSVVYWGLSIIINLPQLTWS